MGIIKTYTCLWWRGRGNAVTELDGKISRKEGTKADRQKDLDALKANKISALPEFFDKVHNQMQAALDGTWEC